MGYKREMRTSVSTLSLVACLSLGCEPGVDFDAMSPEELAEFELESMEDNEFGLMEAAEMENEEPVSLGDDFHLIAQGAVGAYSSYCGNGTKYWNYGGYAYKAVYKYSGTPSGGQQPKMYDIYKASQMSGWWRIRKNEQHTC